MQGGTWKAPSQKKLAINIPITHKSVTKTYLYEAMILETVILTKQTELFLSVILVSGTKREKYDIWQIIMTIIICFLNQKMNWTLNQSLTL